MLEPMAGSKKFSSHTLRPYKSVHTINHIFAYGGLSMSDQWLSYIQDPEIQKTITWVGGCIVAAAATLGAAYKWFRSIKKPSDDNKGAVYSHNNSISVGGNVIDSQFNTRDEK